MPINAAFTRPVSLGAIDKKLAKVHPRLSVASFGPYFTDDELLSLDVVAAAHLTLGAAPTTPRHPTAFVAAAINRDRNRWLRQEKPAHVCDYGPVSWGEAARGHCIECGARRPGAGE